jgi:hypothetical protein
MAGLFAISNNASRDLTGDAQGSQQSGYIESQTAEARELA